MGLINIPESSLLADQAAFSRSLAYPCNPETATAHAKVVAIRNACRKLATYDLSGCEIYCSCEPCPMCQGAIYWSSIARVYFAVNRHNAIGIEFLDTFIYEELAKPIDKRVLPIVQVPCDGTLDVFEAWTRLAGRVMY